jgi:hypothetical protein
MIHGSAILNSFGLSASRKYIRSLEIELAPQALAAPLLRAFISPSISPRIRRRYDDATAADGAAAIEPPSGRKNSSRVSFWWPETCADSPNVDGLVESFAASGAQGKDM